MDKKIAVLAPGAIGGIIGVQSTRAGHDVVLIDQWPAHVDAMKAHGLRVTIGPRENPEADHVVPVRAYHLHEVCTFSQQFDIIFLTCKSYDTVWMVQFIEPYLKPDGVLVSAQNSLNDEWIAPIIGYTRSIGCVLSAGGWLLEPGHVWRDKSMEFPNAYTLGELHGEITPRLEDLATILENAGNTRVTTNLWGGRWSKLMYNSMMSGLAGLAGKRAPELMDAPNYQHACLELGKEAMQVGRALGYGMEPIFHLTAEDFLGSPDEVCESLMWASARGTSSGTTNMVQQDLRRGRPTEIGSYLNGLVIRKGREANVPTPMNDAVTELFLRLECGELRQDVSNFELLPSAPAGQ